MLSPDGSRIKECYTHKRMEIQHKKSAVIGGEKAALQGSAPTFVLLVLPDWIPTPAGLWDLAG